MEDLIIKLDKILNWGLIDEIKQYTIEQATTMQQIPAPTFHEKDRAEYVRQQFAELKLQDITMDSVFNVYGRLPGQNPHQPALIICAHTDTVFSAETDLTLQYEANVIRGPGLGDNCFGTGGLLGLLQFLRRANITPGCDLWFVATSREEGLGDLGGIKAAYAKLADGVGSMINLEGLAFGHIYHAGIAVRRLHITASAGGGHSWLHFGRASAVHGIIELGAHIITLDPPHQHRTTFNIGMIEGGQGINVIASSAGLWLDIRSESSDTLSEFESQIRQIIQEMESPDLAFTVDVVGDRPAGQISARHPLVQGAIAALTQVGVQGMLETGSTDANVPLAAGCPSVTIGITRGGNAHRLDEYVELEYVEAGLRQLILLALAASGTENL